MGGAFVCTLVLGVNPNTKLFDRGMHTMNGAKTEQADKTETLTAPVSGKIIPLKEVKDEAFASYTLGEGVAILPSEGKIVSPVSGTVVTVTDTKHAIGIISDSRAEILIHVGLDTVNLKGKHFGCEIVQNQRVKQGDELISFDIKQIQAEGYDITTPVVVLNSVDYRELTPVSQSSVKANAPLLTLKGKAL